jgi:hypothetical protein
MTPLQLMSRQTFLGWLFLGLGLLLVALAGAPIVVALRTHAPPPPLTMLFLVFLAFGIGLAVFGAWLLPSSGVPAAGASFIAVIGPYLPSVRIPGVSRVDDPKPAPPAPKPREDP